LTGSTVEVPKPALLLHLVLMGEGIIVIFAGKVELDLSEAIFAANVREKRSKLVFEA